MIFFKNKPIISVLILLFLVFMWAAVNSISEPKVNYVDDQKASAFRNVTTALDVYFKEHGQYPDNEDLAVYMEEGKDCVPVDGEDNLADVIGLYSLNDPEKKYRYGVNNENPTEYVLATTFDSSERIPQNDLNGNIFGCDCDGLNYCIGKFEN